ncbi:hypothetical protein BJV78DRAFT_1151138 [Lactifluus subvellereus]|nr:hypothetical protein BJV78DRAFT_1151138 [Lactifluus subvellereus]
MAMARSPYSRVLGSSLARVCFHSRDIIENFRRFYTNSLLGEKVPLDLPSCFFNDNLSDADKQAVFSSAPSSTQSGIERKYPSQTETDRTGRQDVKELRDGGDVAKVTIEEAAETEAKAERGRERREETAGESKDKSGRSIRSTRRHGSLS